MLTDGLTLIEGSEIANATIATGSILPSSPDNGELFYLSSGSVGFYIYQAGSWIRITTATAVNGGGGGGGGIESQTAKTTSYSVQASDNTTALTNYGATDSITFLLPDASTVLGKAFEFHKTNSYNVVIQAATGQYIQDSTAGGLLTNSTDVDASVLLRAIQTGVSTYNWHIVSGFGTWVTS